MHEGLKSDDDRRVPIRVEGLPEATWVLVDYGDLLVHVMTEEAREYYELEKLWGELPKLPVNVVDDAEASKTSFGAASTFYN